MCQASVQGGGIGGLAGGLWLLEELDRRLVVNSKIHDSVHTNSNDYAIQLGPK